MKLNATPVVAEEGAFTAKCVAAPEALMFCEVPVMVLVTVSVAVMVWLPEVRRVAVKVPVPLVRVVLAGNTACPSELVKCTVPL